MSVLLKQGLVAVCVFVFAMALNAEDYVVTVNAGDADITWSATSEAGPAALLANDFKDRRLVKMGGGRLIIACDLKGAGYAGEIYVQEGFLRLRHDGACGTSAGGVTVVSGATLEGDPTYASGSLKYSNEPLTFEGFGVGGVEGAVKMLGGSPSTWNFFTDGKKTMTGDALWIGLSRLDVHDDKDKSRDDPGKGQDQDGRDDVDDALKGPEDLRGSESKDGQNDADEQENEADDSRNPCKNHLFCLIFHESVLLPAQNLQQEFRGVLVRG